MLLFWGSIQLGMAQVGIGTPNPDPSAQLEVQSATKGLLVPRVTSTANVSAPAEALLVYQTSAPAGFYVYRAGSWARLLTTADASGTSAGTIVPYASGTPVTMRNGAVKAVSLIGFGNAVSGVYLINNAVDLSGGGGAVLNFAFSMPRSGSITAITAYFSNIAAFTANSAISVTAQVYQAVGSTNSFTPVSGALVTLTPALSGTVSANVISSGLTSGLNIPVTAGSRLLLVFSLSTSDPAAVVNGYVSGGVTIN